MSNLGETILVVEDDPQIRNFIGFTLRSEGYAHETAANGKSAMQAMVSKPIDLMLLDLGLPDVDGMEIIQKVREWSEIPIIVVSARDQDKEKALALDMGADDYLTKPFSSTELLARIRVALRHMYKQGGGKTQTLFQIGELQLDAEKRRVFLQGEELHVTPMEYSLLSLLFRNQGKVSSSGKYGAPDTETIPRRSGRLWPDCAGSWKKIPPSRGISSRKSAWDTGWRMSNGFLYAILMRRRICKRHLYPICFTIRFDTNSEGGKFYGRNASRSRRTAPGHPS